MYGIGENCRASHTSHPQGKCNKEFNFFDSLPIPSRYRSTSASSTGSVSCGERESMSSVSSKDTTMDSVICDQKSPFWNTKKIMKKSPKEKM